MEINHPIVSLLSLSQQLQLHLCWISQVQPWVPSGGVCDAPLVSPPPRQRMLCYNTTTTSILMRQGALLKLHFSSTLIFLQLMWEISQCEGFYFPIVMDSRLSPCVYPSPFSLLLHLMSFSLKSHSYIFPPAQKLTTHKAELSWLGNHGYGRLRLVAFSFCEIDNELSTRRTMGLSSYSM